MTTPIFRIPKSFPGAAKLYRDRVISPGSKYLFDFENAYCNPYPRSANFAAGATFKNLVKGAADAVVFGATVANGAAGKGIKLPGVNDNGVDFGTGYDTVQRSFLVILWTARRTGDAPAAHSHIFGRNSGSGSGQYFITGSADGFTPAATLGLDGVLASSVNVGGVLANEVPQQLAFMFNDETRTGWRNGVLQNTFANAGAVVNSGTVWTEGVGRKTTAGTTAVLGFNTGWQGSILRAYKEDLTTYSAVEADRLAWASAQVLADYQNNVGRFS